MSKGQLIYLEEVTTYQPLHDPKKHTLSVRLVCDLDSHVCVWLFFFFFFGPAPLALFMGHKQCIKANE